MRQSFGCMRAATVDSYAMLETFALIALGIGIIYFLALIGSHQWGKLQPGAFFFAGVITAIFLIVQFWHAFWGRHAGFAFLMLLLIAVLAFAFWNSKPNKSD